ncbi:hypothetical protein [Streptomyces rimosus]|uniref:hypothetical protein n=1 Tax=Streptomyces rimosus TaxID=1927 RepID=UPI001F473669|nr:hypothetical protein [Streptomyces rimosus]
MPRTRRTSALLATALALAALYPASAQASTERTLPSRAPVFDPPPDEVHTWKWNPIDNRYYLQEKYPCTYAHNFKWPTGPVDAVNNQQCGRRVWLYENFDSTGYKRCFSPGTISSRISDNRIRYPGLLAVGAASPCP